MGATDQRLRAILTNCGTIAVLGAHDDPARAAHYVPEYLRSHGYRVLPVNPRKAGARLFGEIVRARLTDLTEPVDLVDVFRGPDALPGHTAEILAMAPLPRVVWLQLGIRHERVAAELRAAGIEVVQDRCTLATHRALGLGPRGPQPGATRCGSRPAGWPSTCGATTTTAARSPSTA